jgi:hypothetical protein
LLAGNIQCGQVPTARVLAHCFSITQRSGGFRWRHNSGNSLAYYWLHADEIHRNIDNEERLAAEMKAKAGPSPIQERLAEQHAAGDPFPRGTEWVSLMGAVSFALEVHSPMQYKCFSVRT